MTFADDERGQPVVIGALLIFTILILAFSGYQAFVVPQQNAEVEFNHNQEVQNDMQDTRSSILRTAGQGTRQSTAVKLGTTYPSRVIALNPSPAAGTLRTGEELTVSIRNAEADGEAGDYWDGTTTRSFSTRPVSYRPNYNLYDNAPTTTIEHAVIYNGFDDGTLLPQSGQPIVSGRSLSFALIDGEYSQNGFQSTSFDTRPVSTSSNRVSIESDGSPIEIQFETEIPESVWVGELLNNQIDGAASSDTTCADVGTGGDTDPDRYIQDCTYDDTTDPNTLTIVLEADATYDLQTDKVGVGDGSVDAPTTAYITTESGDGATISDGSNQRVVAEVRDEYGNPLSGVDTCAEVTSGGGSIAESPTTATTGEDGQVSFTYQAPSDTSTNAEVTVAYTCTGSNNPVPGAPNSESAIFEIQVFNTDGGGPGPSSDALITAVEPNPAKLTDANGEFVRLQIPSGVDTNGWTLSDDDASYGISQDFDGEVYLARDKTAFEDQWPVDSSKVFEWSSIQLANTGETIELIDSSGNVVDRMGYGDGSFSDGSSVTQPTDGDVAYRTQDGGNFEDTDSESDWAQQAECDFFGGGDGCSGGNQAPTVTVDNVDYSSSEKELTVEFTPDDADGNLDTAEIIIKDKNGNQDAIRQGIDISNQEGTKVTETFSNLNKGGRPYTATVTVTDTDSATDSDSGTSN
ncbi:hypothetical protein GJ631_05000 [Natronomonas sp. CBA1123]|uniref:hypothetical protein n=1 Tax=Natronomonas sp. CBA1123 TaxID=2668070 RepID=UPI0012EA3BFE|nr:hypothetical protein [Natronomonas sp. CBA1123]MUV85945.1 hypothetical protein [Natronomonas sp. CBA1123]